MQVNAQFVFKDLFKLHEVWVHRCIASSAEEEDKDAKDWRIPKQSFQWTPFHTVLGVDQGCLTRGVRRLRSNRFKVLAVLLFHCHHSHTLWEEGQLTPSYQS